MKFSKSFSEHLPKTKKLKHNKSHSLKLVVKTICHKKSKEKKTILSVLMKTKHETPRYAMYSLLPMPGFLQ